MSRRLTGRHDRRGRARLAVGGVLVAAVAGGLLAATAYAATSYTDSAGDANEAPDIAAVVVDDAGAGAVAVRVTLANFRVLPPDSRLLLRFDLDQDEDTGAQGDELTIRYSSEGVLDFFRWNGADLVPLPATGMSATFADGTLTYTVDRAQLGGATSFGLVAVAARTQNAGIGLVVSTDFAPGSGRHVYSAPGRAAYADPDGDNDVAPDITNVAVSDTPGGRLTFRLTTANFATLPPDKLIGIGFDIRGRPSSDDFLSIGYLSGDKVVEVDREQRGSVQPVEGATGVTASHLDGVLTFSLPRRLLDGASGFGFGIVSADLVGPGESEGAEFEGEVEALDSAPDDLAGGLYPYRLANPGPLLLRTGAVVGGASAPRAGRPFTVATVVRRLDTYQVLRQGSVACSASIGGARISARGRFRSGRAQCTLALPAGKAGALTGTLTVRSSGASVRSPFGFVVG